MYLHANAKLGLAGRLALVRAVEDGLSLKAAAAVFSVSPATAHRWWHRWLDGGREAGALLDRSSRPQPLAAAARGRAGGADLRLSPADRLGATAGRRRDRLRALDGLEGAASQRPLTVDGRRAGSRPTATSGPARATCCTWTQAATPASCGPATALPATAHSRSRGRSKRDAGRLRLRPRDRRRPLPARLRRAPRRREGSDRDRLRGTRPRLLRRARDRRQAADDRQRVQPTSTTAPSGSCSPDNGIRHLTNEAIPAPHQRQGRTLPPDDGPRMGLRTHLPLTSTTQHRPCHTGSTTTTTDDHTARSETDPRSAAFTTSVGRTTSRRG